MTNGAPAVHAAAEADGRPTMQAWAVIDGRVERVQRPVPKPGRTELLVRVEACGVCRTDLHLIDRELEPHGAGVVPGHQIVGTVVERGPVAERFASGDRVGIAWLRATCGRCDWCRSGRENLCPDARFTGWDADGGFAEFAVVEEAFAYPLDRRSDPADLAPLLCAGIIGHRALRRAALPPGGRLAIFGFGSSAHLCAASAAAAGVEVVVVTRGRAARELAALSGYEVTASEREPPPRPVDSAIVFAPAGELVPIALGATRPGGTVVLAGIHLSDIPPMAYDTTLFRERDLRSVTANTRRDGDEFLALAAHLRLAPMVHRYAFEALPAALDDLRAGRVAGSLVLLGTGGDLLP